MKCELVRPLSKYGISIQCLKLNLQRARLPSSPSVEVRRRCGEAANARPSAAEPVIDFEHVITLAGLVGMVI